ncbi:MAG: NADH-quinone oxidoreductase subunit NuoE [Verrucomicrobia bacterium]|jgi:NADH-quinone oxidoreductase subunit E|nr:NADH-quinone oxidoreductase subunit NuoE [Verrucomicrobiota bacterium]
MTEIQPLEAVPNPLQSQPDFAVPTELESALDQVITHYPQKRSASLMLLHAIQERYGFVSEQAVHWVAGKLDLQPIHLLELVTFYPMFHRRPVGKWHLKVCRTLSCALAGSYGIHRHFCETLGLDAHAHGPQTTKDGKFTVEFVECLAACGTAPVLMCNETLHEQVTEEKARQILGGCA